MSLFVLTAKDARTIFDIVWTIAITLDATHSSSQIPCGDSTATRQPFNQVVEEVTPFRTPLAVSSSANNHPVA